MIRDIKWHHFNMEQYIPYSLACDLLNKNLELYLYCYKTKLNNNKVNFFLSLSAHINDFIIYYHCAYIYYSVLYTQCIHLIHINRYIHIHNICINIYIFDLCITIFVLEFIVIENGTRNAYTQLTRFL